METKTAPEQREADELPIHHMRLICVGFNPRGFRADALKPVIALFPYYRVKTYALDLSPDGAVENVAERTDMPEAVRKYLQVRRGGVGDDASTLKNFWRLVSECDPGSLPNCLMSELSPRDFRQTAAACRVMASKWFSGGPTRGAREWPFESLPEEFDLEELKGRMISFAFPRRLTALIVAARAERDGLLPNLSLVPHAWVTFMQLGDGVRRLGDVWPWDDDPDLFGCREESFEEFCRERRMPRAVCIVITDDSRAAARAVKSRGLADAGVRSNYPAVVVCWSPRAEKKVVRAWVTRPLGRVTHSLPREHPYSPRPELEARLHDACKEGSPRVVCLVGVGGTGKTALLQNLLRECDVFGEEPRGVDAGRGPLMMDSMFAWDFRADQQPGAFLWGFANYLNPGRLKAASGEECLGFIRDGLRERQLRRTLLVLDGLDILQRRSGDSADEGELRPDLLRRLLEEIAAGELPVVAVVSTRFEPSELKGRFGDGYVRVGVGGLAPEEARAILRDTGCRGGDAELDELAERFDRHALIIYHLGRLLGEYHGGEPHAYGGPTLGEDVFQKAYPGRPSNTDLRIIRQVSQLFARYEEHFGRDEVEVLRRAATFDMPLSVGEFAQIFTDDADKQLAGGLAGVSNEALQSSFEALCVRRLLEVYVRPDEPVRYAVHPVLTQHFSVSYLAEVEGRYGAATKSGAGRDAARVRAGVVRTRGGAGGPQRPRSAHPTNPAVLDLLEKILKRAIRAGRFREARVFYQRRIGGDDHLRRIGQGARAARLRAQIDEAGPQPT